jgi:hypothetical protein
MKIMLVGADNLFGLWLSFFREHLTTFISAIVLLPLTLILNWRLGLLLMVLVVIFGGLAAFVIRRTEGAQRQVESLHTQLAGMLRTHFPTWLWSNPSPGFRMRRGFLATSSVRSLRINSRC